MVTKPRPPPPSMPQVTLATPEELVEAPHPVWFARVKSSSIVLLLIAAVSTSCGPRVGERPLSARLCSPPGSSRGRYTRDAYGSASDGMSRPTRPDRAAPGATSPIVPDEMIVAG